MDNAVEHERAKYLEVWSNPQYREYSPGEEVARSVGLDSLFRRLGVTSILDAGCGSGKTLRFFQESREADFDLTGFDIAENCLDAWFDAPENKVPLQIGSLWDRDAVKATYDAVLCTDVLEHIPTDRIDAVLSNLHAWTGKVVFLGIALFEDHFGEKLVNEPLHLTVEPPTWWRERIEAAGFSMMMEKTAEHKGNPAWYYVMARPS